MKKSTLVIISCLILVAAAAGSYVWVNAIMDSLYDFRSPLAENPPAPGDAPIEPLTDRVVFILVDALREDTSLKTDVMPYLNSLRQQGAWATMHSRTPSYSSPGWATLLTGAWADINDSQAANPPAVDQVRPFTQDNIFTAAQRAGYQTAVSGYSWFEGMLSTSGVDAGFYTIGEDNAADIDVVDAASTYLADGSYQLVLIHLDQVDYSGHYQGGPQGPNWDAAAARVDAMIEEIVSQLDLNTDTVIVTSDHGHIEAGGHGGQDAITLIEPFVAIGKAVVPGEYDDILMVDVAPTITTLLGLNVPSSNQGRVLTEMLSLTADQSGKLAYALQAQQLLLLDSYLAAIDSDAPGQAPSSPREFLDAIDTARAERLAKERIPRGIIALVAVIGMVWVLVSKGGKQTPWLVGAALFYTAVFNLIYAVIVGKTYSLSSVTSATDLIVSSATYTAIGLLIAWLAGMLGLRAFSQKPGGAAQLSLNLVLTIAFLLLLPILWNYFNNGLVITWTLPEFLPMFLGFISIIQLLIVSALGILLAGIAALVAKLTGPKTS